MPDAGAGAWDAAPVTNGPPQRIVSLVPSTTQSVVALAGAGRLVGRTRYCVEPEAELQAVARIGGTKNPAREAIAALSPDLVLGNAEENRVEDLDWLAARMPVLVQTPCTVAQGVQCLRELAVALHAQERAARWLDPLAALLAQRAESSEASVRVFYAIWRKPWMSINRDTYIHDVLRLAGACNVTADRDVRYPQVELDELAKRSVDAVLLPDEPWIFDAAQRDELVAARCFGSAELALCDGRDFCWHGIRMLSGLERARTLVRNLRAGCERRRR